MSLTPDIINIPVWEVVHNDLNKSVHVWWQPIEMYWRMPQNLQMLSPDECGKFFMEGHQLEHKVCVKVVGEPKPTYVDAKGRLREKLLCKEQRLHHDDPPIMLKISEVLGIKNCSKSSDPWSGYEAVLEDMQIYNFTINPEHNKFIKVKSPESLFASQPHGKQKEYLVVVFSLILFALVLIRLKLRSSERNGRHLREALMHVNTEIIS
eukprot:gnl/MRDRNA2_/MRDRNA2_52958_c0_seq1.p1 gnl/MRDRNA2_/MRDRNA2_52958_c0~~gnl/MRDRNA2_/MRDRNA2_52958_c0_seq1.p1  ORF type:complete len:208 (+),score=31.76 gnl/MRDRNA2_/MRDRNA2_52958_c0_seq1:164-787(+)